MGQRIARLTHDRDGEFFGFAVYQSTVMMMFDQIFDNNEITSYLEARIFADALEMLYPSWDAVHQGELVTQISSVISTLYTDAFEDRPSRNSLDQMAMLADDDEKVHELALRAMKGVRK